MYKVLEELTVILITIWWLKKLGKDSQDVNKQHRSLMRKLNELEVRKQYQIEITNRFAALENLGDGEDINRAWENIKENIKTSAKESLGLHEMKQHRP